MRNFLLIALSCFLINSALCQNDVKSPQQSVIYIIDTIPAKENYFFVKHYKVSKDTVLTSTHYVLDTNSTILVHGLAITYSNGKPCVFSFYHLGKREGIEIWFSNNYNSIELQVEYHADTINGLVVEYFPNGKIKNIGNCYGGLTYRYGVWTSFYENGNKKSVGMYGLIKHTDDFQIKNIKTDMSNIKDLFDFAVVRFGEWTYYDINGEIKRIETITEPQLILNATYE